MVFNLSCGPSLSRLGSSKLVSSGSRTQFMDVHDWEESVDGVKSVKYLSMNRIRALICMQRQTGLEDYVETESGNGSMVKAENTPLSVLPQQRAP